MNAAICNFKRYDSGAMVGFFDLVVGGIVVTGCKAFRKDDKLWFAWPSEKITDAAGEAKYKDIVAAAEPVMRHLQNCVRGQLRAALDGKPEASQPGPPPASRFRFNLPRNKADRGDIDRHRSNGMDDDIPF